MRPLKQHLVDYLQSISGSFPELTAEPASTLPLFLRARCQLYSVPLFGRPLLLALVQDGENPDSPGSHQKFANQLHAHLGKSVVLVLDQLSSHARNRMVQIGIPFIVPGTQLFIPTVLMDLRERFPRPISAGTGKPLTPAAQSVVLYHLQRQSMENLSLREIALKIGYSPIMLTNVKAELEAAQLCRTVRQGRSLTLQFLSQGRGLWQQAQPFLSSPVKYVRWLHWNASAQPKFAAGMTALSRRTLITDDRLPTFASLISELAEPVVNGGFQQVEEPALATLRMEIWQYDPALLAKEGMVDSLSLYLSLRESPDERIQQQLAILLEEMAW